MTKHRTFFDISDVCEGNQETFAEEEVIQIDENYDCSSYGNVEKYQVHLKSRSKNCVFHCAISLYLDELRREGKDIFPSLCVFLLNYMKN